MSDINTLKEYGAPLVSLVLGPPMLRNEVVEAVLCANSVVWVQNSCIARQ